MLRIDQARAFPRALGFMLAGLVTVSGCSGAAAKSRIRKQAIASPAIEETSIPVAATPPVRFFTINQVLAKKAGQPATGSGHVALASIAPNATGAAVASDAAPAAPAMPAVSDEPFGLFTFRAPEGILWTKWRGVAVRMHDELKDVADCKANDEACRAGARRFLAVVRSAADMDLRARAEQINRDVNSAVRYVGDYQQHGVADLWSSPLETLAAGAGDCEDYALAKYAMLSATGVPDSDLKLILVRDMAVRQDHAVLGVRIDGRWMVLDNRYARLTETRDLTHFMPLFAIDHTGVSLFAAPYAARLHHESETDMMPAAEAVTAGGGSSLPLVF